MSERKYPLHKTLIACALVAVAFVTVLPHFHPASAQPSLRYAQAAQVEASVHSPLDGAGGNLASCPLCVLQRHLTPIGGETLSDLQAPSVVWGVTPPVAPTVCRPHLDSAEPRGPPLV